MNCKEARILMGPLVDRELSPVQRRALEGHLGSCTPCSRRAAFETSFHRMLRESLREEAVPASLLGRIRRGLADEARSMEPGRRWFRRTAAGWAVAATLAVAYLLPAGFGRLPGIAGWRSLAAGHAHSILGVLVCLECDRAGIPPERQQACRAFDHHAALRTESGERWSFAPGGAGSDLGSRPDLRGTRVRLDGTLYPRIHVVDVRSFTLDA